jgi:cytochrome b
MTGSADPTITEATARVAVWDAPVRFVHWLIALLIPFSWWTAEQEMMEWHYRSGLTILGLLVFRLIWGVIGSSTARFASFVRGPRRILDHLRGRREFMLGHNPLGALSVLALLAMLVAQVTLGLFAADEDGLESGPLAHLVDADLGEKLTELHETGFYILLVLIALHVTAILFYLLVKRRNLVAPMITGKIAAPPDTAPMRPAGAVRFLAAALLAAAFVWWIANGA